MPGQHFVLDDNAVALAGPAYDRPPSPLKRLVVIAATARTGSYLLARLLKQAGYGIGLEYFHGKYSADFARRWGVADGPGFWPDYLDAVVRHRTTDGVCVTKCMPQQLAALSAGLAARAALRDRLHYVHVWRRDHLAQAISLRLAYQSGIWDFTEAPTTRPDGSLDLSDVDALQRTARRLVLEEAAWRRHLRRAGAPVTHVAYEDLVADREGTLRRVIAAIDPQRTLPSPLPLDEPPTGAALRARQRLSEAERAALRRAYEDRFGPDTSLPEP